MVGLCYETKENHVVFLNYLGFVPILFFIILWTCFTRILAVVILHDLRPGTIITRIDSIRVEILPWFCLVNDKIVNYLCI